VPARMGAQRRARRDLNNQAQLWGLKGSWSFGARISRVVGHLLGSLLRAHRLSLGCQPRLGVVCQRDGQTADRRSAAGWGCGVSSANGLRQHLAQGRLPSEGGQKRSRRESRFNHAPLAIKEMQKERMAGGSMVWWILDSQRLSASSVEPLRCSGF